MEGLVARGNIKKSNIDLYVIDVSIDETFQEKFKEAYGIEADTFNDVGYDTVMILVDALKNKPENMTLSDYMRDEVNYKGYAGTYDFDENGDISGGDWVIKKIK